MDTFNVHLSIEAVRELLADKEAMEDAVVKSEEEEMNTGYEDRQKYVFGQEGEMRQEEEEGEEGQQEEEGQNEDMRREEENKHRQVEEEEQRWKRVEIIKLEEKQRRRNEQCQEKVKTPEEMRRGRRNYKANSMIEGRSLNRSRSPIRSRSISRSSTRSRSRSSSSSSQNKKEESEVLSKEQWVELLTPGILKTMHEHGIASSGQSNFLQLLAKEVRDGLVVSATMSDGKFVSSNIFPGGQEVARAMVAWPEYCMLRPDKISVHKNKLIIGMASVTDGQVFQQPLPAQGVTEFEYLNSQTLLLWGLKFPQEMPVRCSFKIRPAKA